MFLFLVTCYVDNKTTFYSLKNEVDFFKKKQDLKLHLFLSEP